QTLNSTGGLPRVDSLRRVPAFLLVNGNERWLHVAPEPIGWCAMTLDQGDFVAALPRLPPESGARSDAAGPVPGGMRRDPRPGPGRGRGGRGETTPPRAGVAA